MLDSGRKEIGQLSSEEGNAIAEGEQYPEISRSLDSLREMRLLALSGNLIGERGETQAAKTLGTSPCILTRFEDGRRLTPTLARALERHPLEGVGRRRSELLDYLIVNCKMLRLRRFLTFGLWRT